MKIGSSLTELIHSSGEDILISYRTGAKVQIKDGMIIKIFDINNHNELNWQLNDWKKTEDQAAIEIEEKQLKAFHKAAAKEHAKKLKESKKAAAAK